MNLRRKRKAWKKFIAELTGEPSGFGEMTPREREAIAGYFEGTLLKGVTFIADGMKTWGREVSRAIEGFSGGGQ